MCGIKPPQDQYLASENKPMHAIPDLGHIYYYVIWVDGSPLNILTRCLLEEVLRSHLIPTIGAEMTNVKSLAVCMVVVTTPALAQTDAQVGALDATVAEMTDALVKGNMVATVEMLPPAMLQSMASDSGMEPDQLLQMMRDQLEAAAGAVVSTDVEFDSDAIEWKTTEDGQDYALVPGAFVVEATDPSTDSVVTMKQTATYIGIPDDGEWYVIDISNPAQQAIFASAYPDYEGITVPAGTMEMVQ